MPSKPPSSEPQETPRSLKLRKRLHAIEAEIDKINMKAIKEPSSIRLAMDLAGLNAQKWSTLGAIETELGNLQDAVRCTRQELDWSTQQSRLAGKLESEALQELAEMMKADHQADREFAEDEQEWAMNGSAS